MARRLLLFIYNAAWTINKENYYGLGRMGNIIGKAMQITGAAEMIATNMVGLVAENPWMVLTVIYGVRPWWLSVL